MSANKVAYNANGDPFSTRNDLITAASFYFQGELCVPQPKDYCTVLADETHGGAQTRYAFDGSIWTFQFLVNDTPFTAAQNAAINSGITEQLVAQIGNHDFVKTSVVMVNTGDRVELRKDDLTIWVQRSPSAEGYSPETAGFTFDTARDWVMQGYRTYGGANYTLDDKGVSTGRGIGISSEADIGLGVGTEMSGVIVDRTNMKSYNYSVIVAGAANATPNGDCGIAFIKIW
jgi:hypothetical protein